MKLNVQMKCVMYKVTGILDWHVVTTNFFGDPDNVQV